MFFKNLENTENNLVKSDCWSHGGFDVERPDVLPLFLQQGNQEIDGHVDVLDQLIVVHLDITYGNSQTKDFLHLEFDGSFHLFDFANHIVSLSQDTWKLTGFVQTWSQQSWNLSDQCIGGQESIVLLGKFLDKLLILVEFFQIFNRHVWNSVFGGFIDVSLVTKNANGEFWSGGVRKFDGTGESLVFLGIIKKTKKYP